VRIVFRRFYIVDFLIAAALCGLIVLRAWPARSHARAAVDPVEILGLGSSLKLDGWTWSTRAEHVVLLLNTTCGACNAEASFYRVLSSVVRSSNDFGFLVLSADSEGRARSWLAENGIEPQASLHVAQPVALGFLAVPTIMIVDRAGTVTDMLVNVLTGSEETALLDRITHQRRDPVTNVTPVRETTAREWRAAGGSGRAVVVNVADRAVFSEPAAKNELHIPWDELWLRAPQELPKNRPIVLDCSLISLFNCRATARLLTSAGFANVMLLKSQ
jgi:rhodanese-related sulfurtransferase